VSAALDSNLYISATNIAVNICTTDSTATCDAVENSVEDYKQTVVVNYNLKNAGNYGGRG